MATKFSNPFSITIKNLSEDKFYTVDIFNEKPNENKKIEYKAHWYDDGEKAKDYQELIELLRLNPCVIGLVHKMAISPYRPFERKQVTSDLLVVNKESREIIQSISCKLDPMQNLDNVLNMRTEFEHSSNDPHTLCLEYLLPVSEITLSFYPKKNKDGEDLVLQNTSQYAVTNP